GDPALSLGRVDHGNSDAVLHRPQGIEILQFRNDVGLASLRHPAKADERRISNRLRDVIVDPPAETIRFGRRHDSLPPETFTYKNDPAPSPDRNRLDPPLAPAERAPRGTVAVRRDAATRSASKLRLDPRSY